MIAVSKDDVAAELIRWHFAIYSEINEIYRFLAATDEEEERPNEPIKLLEISPDTITTGRVDTFTFAPAGDITFPTRVAHITPDEMQQVRNGEIPLPEGWQLSRVILHRR